MQFETSYNRTRQSPEQNSGQLIVDRAGYIPAKQRIEAMINAGARLIMSRREQFDFPDGQIDYNLYDPTRSKNFDLADAFQLQQRVETNIQEYRSKASQTVQELSGAPEINTEG